MIKKLFHDLLCQESAICSQISYSSPREIYRSIWSTDRKHISHQCVRGRICSSKYFLKALAKSSGKLLLSVRTCYFSVSPYCLKRHMKTEILGESSAILSNQCNSSQLKLVDDLFCSSRVNLLLPSHSLLYTYNSTGFTYDIH